MAGRKAVALGLVLAAGLSALGALILGEYEFSGSMPFAAGVLFGLVVAEVVAAVGHRRDYVVAGVTAAFVAEGLVWAAWISSGEGLRPLPRVVWAAVALGVAAVFARTGPTLARRPGRSRSHKTSGQRPGADE